MNHANASLYWICLILTMALAISSFVISLPKTFGNLHASVNYLDAIVAIYSTFVTVLLGWQIWQTINAKGQIEQLRSEFKAELHLNLFNVFFYQGKSEHEHQKPEFALNYYIRSLDCATRCSVSKMKIIDIIKCIKLLLVEYPTITLNSKDVDIYIDILKCHSHKDIESIVVSIQQKENPSEQPPMWNELSEP